MDKIFVVHGSGLSHPGTEQEKLSLEGELRVTTLFEALYKEQQQIQPEDTVTVVFSGGRVEEGQRASEAELMRASFETIGGELTEALGIRILVEDTSVNSIQNVDYSIQQIIQALNRKTERESPEPARNKSSQIHLVSSDYHLRRLLQTRKRRIKEAGLGKTRTDISHADLIVRPGSRKKRNQISYRTHGVAELLHSDLDCYTQEAQEAIRRCQSPEIRARLVEFFGRSMAVLGQEGLLAKFPSNAPLSKVVTGIFSRKQN